MWGITMPSKTPSGGEAALGTICIESLAGIAKTVNVKDYATLTFDRRARNDLLSPQPHECGK
jgi:hypothetical protein